MRIVLVIVFFVATTARAQEPLKVNEPVERQLASGSMQSYAIELKAGDYVACLLDQHGRTDLTIVAPDGSSCGTILARQKMGSASASLSRKPRESIVWT